MTEMLTRPDIRKFLGSFRVAIERDQRLVDALPERLSTPNIMIRCGVTGVPVMSATSIICCRP